MRHLIATMIAPLIFFISSPAYPTPKVAVFGDDLANGVGADPRLDFNGDNLWDYLKAIVPLGRAEVPQAIRDFAPSDFAPPVRLWQSAREFKGSRSWLVSHIFSQIVDRYFSTPQLSWAYLVATKLGAKASDIKIAADVEARVSDLSDQVDRYLNHSAMLPDYALVMYAFYDFCAQRMSLLPSTTEYAKALDRGLRYLVRNGEANPNGTVIYLGAPPSVTQLILSEAILDKKVTAHGEESTCRQLSDQAFAPNKPLKETRHAETLWFNAVFPPNPANYCPTLFARRVLAYNELGFFAALNREQREIEISKNADNMTSALSSRLRSFHKQAEQVTADVDAWVKTEYPNKKVSIVFLPSPEDVTFQANDVSNDCFHFTAQGELKIASALWQGIEKHRNGLNQ